MGKQLAEDASRVSNLTPCLGLGQGPGDFGSQGHQTDGAGGRHPSLCAQPALPTIPSRS